MTMEEFDFDVPAELRRELLDCATRTGLSYPWLISIFRRGVATKIGETHQYPYGKLAPDDEGELAVALATDRRQGVIRFSFGKPVEWLALPAKHARELAALLLEKANELDRAKA